MKNKADARPTIKDIARESGYSKAAVSFAFNYPERIGKDSYAVIMETAQRLGYVPNPAARNLSLGKHGSIGLILPQIVQFSLTNPHTQDVINGVGRVCQDHGYSLTLIPPVGENTEQAAKSAAVDAIITFGMKVERDVDSVVRCRKMPWVTIDGKEDMKPLSSVTINDEEAAREMMELVLSKGHRKIAIIGLAQDAFLSEEALPTVGKLRLSGYVRALAKYHLYLTSPGIHHTICESTMEDGAKIAEEILRLEDRPTAVVAMSDIVAIGAMEKFKSEGLSVPGDISVVGFDDIPLARFVTPSLTTVSQSGYQKGEKAAELIFEMLEEKDGEVQHVVIPHKIIERASLSEV